MSKFKKGDRVVSIKTGAKGVVDEVYGEEKYAVLFDGAANPDRVEGFQIRLANARACNGKFKVGDKVWVPAKQKRGVIRGVSATGNQYDVEFMGGGCAYVNEEGLEFLQALGNSDAPVSTNSVVRNTGKAMISRVGSDWYYSWANGAKDGREGPFRSEEEARVSAKQDGFAVANAARSTNSVVRNAIAANAKVARNATRQTFGKVVAVSEDPFEDSSIFIGGGLMHRAEGTTVEKCLVEAEVMLDEYETVVRQLKSAIAWMRTKK